MAKTVRDMVREAQSEMLGPLDPQRCRELLVMLTALMGNCADECRQADMAYNPVLLAAMRSEEAANRAKLVAECSQEYERKRIAQDTKSLVFEMVRSLKSFMRSGEAEMHLTR